METETICPFEIEPSWNKALSDELSKPYLLRLAAFVEKERASNIPIYPPKELVFNAFKQTPYEKVNVLLMGQDPYHGSGQAHGLCFSVPKGTPPPPSLQNIFKELVDDVGIEKPQHGCLTSWAEQGVMLLNATLTVREGNPLSHHGKGWEQFTDAVIAKLCEREDPVIFVLWGRSAREKVRHINSFEGNSRHFMLTAAHPSPFSARNGFFGSHHFSEINELLEKQHKETINWSTN
ncbi:MAG: Uracil-DNA glycosylase [Chlamydiae bacterium]|nr:Uracil-DNA glycosylase [Chlamydiota bacterium]